MLRDIKVSFHILGQQYHGLSKRVLPYGRLQKLQPLKKLYRERWPLSSTENAPDHDVQNWL